MRRKRLNHYADIVCKMFVGWRMAEDLDVLSELSNGVITVNLLTGDTNHSIAGNLELYISKEIQAWLSQQSEKEGINISELESSILKVDINTEKIVTEKKKVIVFNFECSSLIKTDEAIYEGAVKETHKWHARAAT